MQPSSQKDRPISFLLFDYGETNPLVLYQDLVIRPEEMTYSEPSRLTVTQTLGGAWLDDFGPGIASISLNGHTGWRGSFALDGAEMFATLRDTVFAEWHRRRAERPNDTSGPNAVELVLADQLNNRAMIVAPQTFQLRRHKSRPLLSTFNISLLALEHFYAADIREFQDSIRESITAPNRTALARVALEDNIRKQNEAVSALAESGASQAIVDASRDLVTMTNDMLAKINSVAGDIKSGFDTAVGPLLVVGENVLQASRNACQMLAMQSDLALYAKHSLQRIAANYQDAYCNLKNGFERFFDLPDFSDLFGASNCSSTGGGRSISPLATQNPFETVYVPAPVPATVDAQADTALRRLRQDPLTAGFSEAEITQMMRDLTAGIGVRI